MHRIGNLRLFGAAALLAIAGAFLGSCGTARAEGPPPVIAVGDLHGDYEAFAAILGEAGLIDKRGKWTGGNAILVQLGDVPDRGPDTKKIIEHLMKLEKAAKRKGGRVEALIGNHEAMNVTGDLRYVTPEEFAAFATRKSKKTRETYFKANAVSLAEFYRKKDPAMTDEAVKAAFEKDVPLGYLEHRAQWNPKGEFGAFVAAHDAVIKIGDTLFVHGGISAATAAMTIEEINAKVRAALIAGGGPILEDESGPLWHRALATESPEGEADLVAALSAYGVTRIVIGHTPQIAGVKALYGGRVIAADTGASKAYGGTRSFVRIDESGVIANDNGTARKLPGGGP
jgi:hypothetical protein